MILLMTRHGETDFNTQGRYAGCTDVPLNEKGTAQAQMLAEKLKSEPIDVIACSVLKRARQTAESVSAFHPGVPIIFMEEFRERDLGDFEGLTEDGISEKFPGRWQGRRYGVLPPEIPGGESLSEFDERVSSGLEKLKNRFPEKRVLLICHGLVSQAMNRILSGLDFSEMYGFLLKNCEVKRYCIECGGNKGVTKRGCVFFDLDGTLVDSGEGIMNSFVYALGKMGLPVPEKSVLGRYVGPPLLETFSKSFGLPEEKVRPAIAFYREYYREKGVFQNRKYDGVEKMLSDLKSAGTRLAVATSKPEPYAVQVVAGLGLAGYFDVVAGSKLDESRAAKNEVIEYAAERMGITDMSGIVMVGDTRYDAEGAKKAGVRAVGVSYGYGSEKELEDAGAEFIARDPGEVTRYLLGFDGDDASKQIR